MAASFLNFNADKNSVFKLFSAFIKNLSPSEAIPILGYSSFLKDKLSSSTPSL